MNVSASTDLHSEAQVFGKDLDLSSASSKRRLTRLERDRERGYSVNVKQVVLAFCVEFWIIGLIIIGTYLLISESGEHGNVSSQDIFSALLLPAALAMVELARVPLAIAVRTEANLLGIRAKETPITTASLA